MLNAAANYEKSKVNLDFTTAETLTKMGIDIADAEAGKVKHMPNIKGVLPVKDTKGPGAPEGESQPENPLGPPTPEQQNAPTTPGQQQEEASPAQNPAPAAVPDQQTPPPPQQ